MWIVHVTFWIKGHLKVRRLLTQLRTHFNFYSFFLNPTQSLLCQFVKQLPRPSLPCLRQVPDTPCRDSRNEKSCWGLVAVHVVQQCISLYPCTMYPCTTGTDLQQLLDRIQPRPGLTIKPVPHATSSQEQQ